MVFVISTHIVGILIFIQIITDANETFEWFVHRIFEHIAKHLYFLYIIYEALLEHH